MGLNEKIKGVVLYGVALVRSTPVEGKANGGQELSFFQRESTKELISMRSGTNELGVFLPADTQIYVNELGTSVVVRIPSRDKEGEFLEVRKGLRGGSALFEFSTGKLDENKRWDKLNDVGNLPFELRCLCAGSHAKPVASQPPVGFISI